MVALASLRCRVLAWRLPACLCLLFVVFLTAFSVHANSSVAPSTRHLLQVGFVGCAEGGSCVGRVATQPGMSCSGVFLPWLGRIWDDARGVLLMRMPCWADDACGEVSRGGGGEVGHAVSGGCVGAVGGRERGGEREKRARGASPVPQQTHPSCWPDLFSWPAVFCFHAPTSVPTPSRCPLSMRSRRRGRGTLIFRRTSRC